VSNYLSDSGAKSTSISALSLSLWQRAYNIWARGPLITLYTRAISKSLYLIHYRCCQRRTESPAFTNHHIKAQKHNAQRRYIAFFNVIKRAPAKKRHTRQCEKVYFHLCPGGDDFSFCKTARSHSQRARVLLGFN